MLLTELLSEKPSLPRVYESGGSMSLPENGKVDSKELLY